MAITDKDIKAHVDVGAKLQGKLNLHREQIGGLVRAKRLEKGVGQPELATALGVSSMMVQHYETGRNALTADKLVKIAETLKCKTTDLIP